MINLCVERGKKYGEIDLFTDVDRSVLNKNE